MKTLLKTLLLAMASQTSGAQAGSAVGIDEALNLARNAQQHCRTLNRDIAVAVVDASGQALLMLRAEGVGPHNLEAARRKAFTALSTRQPTLQLGRQARSQPDTDALQYLPELLLLGGGVPLRRDGTFIGAIGVAGGGGPENDDACARSAADLIH